MSIAEMSGSSVVTVHVVVVEQQLVVFQTPPPTAARIRDDRAVGGRRRVDDDRVHPALGLVIVVTILAAVHRLRLRAERCPARASGRESGQADGLPGGLRCAARRGCSARSDRSTACSSTSRLCRALPFRPAQAGPSRRSARWATALPRCLLPATASAVNSARPAIATNTILIRDIRPLPLNAQLRTGRPAGEPDVVVHITLTSRNQRNAKGFLALDQDENGRHSAKSHASPPHIGQRIASLDAMAP